MAVRIVAVCHLCGYAPQAPNARWFVRACECLTPDCDGESGDECGEILLCSECA